MKVSVFKFEEFLITFQKVWLQFAHKIKQLITFIFLIILFYFVFSITGFILKLLQKDLLSLKDIKTKSSNWKMIEDELQDFNEQF